MQVLEPDARYRGHTVRHYDDAFLAALTGGGDSRLVIDEATLANKYLCPRHPDDSIACFSSCTASPISRAGFEDALQCFRQIQIEGRYSTDTLDYWLDDVKARLRALVGDCGVDDIILLPSGTDGMLFVSLLLALESPGQVLTAILPAGSETGTGMPLAAACRQFDGPASKTLLHDGWSEPIEVALRHTNGLPRSDDEINQGFAEAARKAPGRPVICLTHGTKTGLVAPLTVPAGMDVVVDACQLRLSRAALQGYLRRGWPVVITGSKFLGGPPFSGAVLLPRGRFDAVRGRALATYRMMKGGSDGYASLGPLLRWVAALSSVRQDDVAADVRRLQHEVEALLAGVPGLWIVPGPSRAMMDAGGMPPGIVTFALRDRADAGRSLSVDELRIIYRALAGRGILIGQPVSLGSFGGMRLAIGMRDIARASIQPALKRFRAGLMQVIG